ncbi:hypothetical protein TGFOU_406070 [Toxoplasma gondii FOU]|uniref:Uncharacterized protein n=1 Tax=Toxoplasma gondii FOU TaxID=943167 RepID=A0A086JTJ8_TOXGO|nr:hypothetical protein TGFOU_406070 [Toxoplasma gondii FOU]
MQGRHKLGSVFLSQRRRAGDEKAASPRLQTQRVRGQSLERRQFQAARRLGGHAFRLRDVDAAERRLASRRRVGRSHRGRRRRSRRGEEERGSEWRTHEGEDDKVAVGRGRSRREIAVEGRENRGFRREEEMLRWRSLLQAAAYLWTAFSRGRQPTPNNLYAVESGEDGEEEKKERERVEA